MIYKFPIMWVELHYKNNYNSGGWIVLKRSGENRIPPGWDNQAGEWDDIDDISITDELFNKYFSEENINRDSTKLLKKLNIYEYKKLLEQIDKVKIKAIKDKGDSDIVDVINKGVNDLIRFKKKFIKWFLDYGIEIPNKDDVNVLSDLPLDINNKITKKNDKDKGGRPPDPKIAELRKNLNKDYYNLTVKKGYKKFKAIKILEEKYPWEKTTIEKYIK